MISWTLELLFVCSVFRVLFLSLICQFICAFYSLVIYLFLQSLLGLVAVKGVSLCGG